MAPGYGSDRANNFVTLEEVSDTIGRVRIIGPSTRFCTLGEDSGIL